MRPTIASFGLLLLLLSGCTSQGDLAVADQVPSWQQLDESGEVWTDVADEDAERDSFNDDDDSAAGDDDDSAHSDDDQDLDGVTTPNDCDDTDPDVYPGAPEVADDGIDQDCSGTDTVSCYLDMDGDDWGSLLAYFEADGVCQPGTTTDNTDCDDNDQGVNPSEEDVCDLIDQDCDGDHLEDFPDTDGDGAPDCVDGPGNDSDGDGYSSEQGDCNEADINIFPTAPEIADDGIDQDCNGADSISCYLDADADGYGDLLAYFDANGVCLAGTAPLDGDCDEVAPEVNPGAVEECDDIDSDCDGDFVETWTDTDADGLPECATDPDGDGDGYSPSEGDCDDVDPLINPGEIDYCNDFDEDCDGDIVEDHPDNDGDGIPECDPAVDDDGDGFAELDGDCRDGDPLINPDAAEIPDNGIDEDCNGFDAQSCFNDHDEDGWGGDVSYIEEIGTGCDSDHVPNGGDCDDGEHQVNPNAFEQCDAIDQDCDGSLESDLWTDTDGDGIPECPDMADNDGDGFNEENNDCDDADASIFPGAVEIADDGIDQDCNGFDGVTCFYDNDGDGFGDTTVNYIELDGLPCDEDSATNSSDCDDTDHETYIGAHDVCDSIDQDCDGDILETHPDTDGDGIPDCPPDYDGDGDGVSDEAGDCDDADPTINPNAAEVPDDGIDQDCNGFDQISCWLDIDGDGFGVGPLPAYFDSEENCAPTTAPDIGDCDDIFPNINPDAADICDEIDQDCDGDIVEGWPDADGDGIPECN